MNDKMFINEKFTKRTQITKCATLELKPYGKTREVMEKLNIIANDKARVQLVKNTAKYIDKYIIDMTSKALGSFDYDFNSLIEQYLNNDKNYGKNCDKLAEAVTKALFSTMSINKAKDLHNAKWIFDDKAVENTLPKYLDSVNDHEGAEIMRSLKGCLGLYHQLMNNKEITISSAIPNRLIANMEIYADNIPLFKRIMEENNAFFKEHLEECSSYATHDGYSLCLTADGIKAYNNIISGEYTEEGNVSKGLNAFLNEENIRIKNSNLDIPYYKMTNPLHKAILVPAPKAFSIDSISSNEELKQVIYNDMDVVSEEIDNIIKTFSEIDMNSYVVTNNIHWLSHALYQDHNYITECLSNYSDKKTAYTIQDIEDAINMKREDDGADLIDISEVLLNYIFLEKATIDAAFTDLDMLGFLSCPNIKDDTDCIRGVIRFTTVIKTMSDFIKVFTVKDNETLFTNRCISHVAVLKINTKATNLARNFVTKNLNSEVVKTRICFNTPGKLEASWFNYKNNIKLPNDKHTIIKMDDKYYLATRTPVSGTISFNPPLSKDDTVYVYSVEKAQDASTQMPKLAFSKEVKNFFNDKKNNAQSTYVLKSNMVEPVVITREQYKIYTKGSFKTSAIKDLGITEEEFKRNCAKICSLYIKIAQNARAYQSYDLSGFKKPEEYSNTGELLSYIYSKSIKMSWIPVSKNQIDELIDNEQLFVFLITNKKMYSDEPRTSYAKLFLSIFSDENMANTNIVLNGSPAIFYRPALLSEKISHQKGTELVNKKDTNGNYIPTFIYQQLYQYYNHKLDTIDLTEDAYGYVKNNLVRHHTSTCDISKDARYRREMFSITFSYKIGKLINNDTSSLINDDVDEIYAKTGNVLAVSRSVNDLLTYCLLDKDGNVLESNDLNKIGEIDFKAKLAQIHRDKEMSENWHYNVKVSDIKEAYITAAVSFIAKLAIENNAIIVTDKISDNVREKWSFLDAQIFGKFVNALRNKLSAYTFKNADNNAVGGILNPLNLSYNTDSWQAGIVYTMPTSYTSTIDTESGFTNEFSLAGIKNSTQIKAFFSKFDDISIKNNELSFSFDYLKFYSKKVIDNITKTDWTIKTKGEVTLLEEANGKKFYHLHEDIISDFKAKASKAKEDINYTDILSSIEDMKPQTVNFLFEIFKSVLYGRKQAYGPNNETMKVSPVTGNNIELVNLYKAKMLGLKYQFFASLDNKLSYEKKNKEWINSFVTSK